MLDNWLILSLIVTISIGIVAFLNKIFAQRKYNVEFSALVLYAMMFFISLFIGGLYGFSGWKEIGYENILLCIVWGIQFYGYSFVMMNALRYLPTSTYFISVRLSSSFILLIVGLIFFHDILSLKEILGFFLGVGAMLLLFEKDSKDRSPDYKKGIWFLLLGIICLVFGHTVTKLLSHELSQVPTLLSISFASAFLTSLIFGYKHIETNKKDFYGIFKMNILQSFFFLVYFYFLFKVYNLGDLGISYKIQSYSPFIPIILAAIVYRERISLKKSIGIILTALSLYFFT